jgi:hypothetical protein
MKNVFASFLLSFFVLNACAQDTVYTYKKKFKNGFQPKEFNSFSAYDEQTGNLHLTLVDNKSIERIIIDSNWNTVNHFSTVRGMYSAFPFDRFSNLQIFVSDNKEYNIYNSNNKYFFINEIDYDKQEERRVQNFELKKKETLVEAFASGDFFCVAIADRNADKLKIITNAKHNGYKVDTIIVDFDFINRSTTLAKDYERVSVLREGDREIAKLLAKKKIYLKGTTVFITAEKFDATHITEVSLLSGEVKTKFFKQQLKDANLTPKEVDVNNSFLYNHILVNGNIYKDECTISLYDYENGTLLNKFSFSKEENINYKSGPILNRNDKEISTKEFIKRAIKEDNIIFELNESQQGNIELGVGICDVNSFGFAQMPVGIFPNMGGFFIGFTFGSGGNKNSNLKKDANFKCFFDKQTLQTTTNYETKSATQPMLILLQEAFEKLQEASCTALSVFKTKDNTFIGFYNQELQSYFIKKLDPQK